MYNAHSGCNTTNTTTNTAFEDLTNTSTNNDKENVSGGGS